MFLNNGTAALMVFLRELYYHANVSFRFGEKMRLLFTRVKKFHLSSVAFSYLTTLVLKFPLSEDVLNRYQAAPFLISLDCCRKMAPFFSSFFLTSHTTA